MPLAEPQGDDSAVLPRRLTDRERDVLVAMIKHGEPGSDDEPRIDPPRRARWLRGMDSTLVRDICECGECPSIDLRDLDGPNLGKGTRDVIAVDHDGAMILLFVDDDRPSRLEMFDVAGTGCYECLPDAEQLDFDR